MRRGRHSPISIHAAREGGDRQRVRNHGRKLFQSTPPVKAATHNLELQAADLAEFQSTPPVKAATIAQQLSEIEQRISIHAAREGGDYK